MPDLDTVQATSDAAKLFRYVIRSRHSARCQSNIRPLDRLSAAVVVTSISCSPLHAKGNTVGAKVRISEMLGARRSRDAS